MYSGTVFTQERTPASDLQLPQTCWAFFDRVDGTTSARSIAEALHLSDAELFAVVQQLRCHDLIGEAVTTYEAYRASSADAAEGDAASRRSADHAANAAASGQTGESGAYELEMTTQELNRTLHVPRLWSWLKSTADNVKDYKNVQAFILMEASDALESIGVEDMEDLTQLDRCSDPDVIRAFEKAVVNNANERIPEQCYQ